MNKQALSASKLAPWNWFRHEGEKSRELARSGDYEHPMVRLHQEVDRLFEDAFRSFGMPGRLMDWDPFGANRQFGLDTPMLLRPKVDIRESDEAYQISVEVPGVKEDDLSLRLDGDCLIISGEKHQEVTSKEDDKVHRVERSYGSFRRMLTLPADARSDDIKAQFKDGVLNITLPRDASKVEQAKTIAIEKG
ncbi:MAG: Hsp20/alpha crystallin family protein [Saccharospirillum sp.]